MSETVSGSGIPTEAMAETHSFDAAGTAGDNNAGVPPAEETHDEYADVAFGDDPRWKEVTTKKKALEKELEGLREFAPVIDRLRGMGYSSADAVTEALSAEEQRLFNQQLAQNLNTAVRNGQIDPATAQARYQAAIREREMSRTLASLAQYEVDRQLQAAKQQFPEMDEELVREIGRANYGRPDFDLAAVARRSHERNLAYLERRLAGYEAERAQQPAAPLSSGRGGFAMSGNAKSALKRSWEDLLGLTKLAQI